MNWWLHELGVPFAPRPPHDSGNPHPFGQIPALLDFTDVEDETRAEDDAVKLWESGAILAYLADRHGPLDTPARRADAGKWIHWANASLDPCLFRENDRGQVLDTGARVRPGAKPARAGASGEGTGEVVDRSAPTRVVGAFELEFRLRTRRVRRRVFRRL